MVRVIRAVPIRQVAGDTGGRQPGIDIVFMACAATHTHVNAGQGERGLGAVVKDRSGPARRHGVAQRTVLRKSGSGVVRIGGAVPIRLMARDTGCGQAGIYPVFVACGACDTHVNASQREFGQGVVVECGTGPRRRAVTDRAVLREA